MTAVVMNTNSCPPFFFLFPVKGSSPDVTGQPQFSRAVQIRTADTPIARIRVSLKVGIAGCLLGCPFRLVTEVPNLEVGLQ
ncbi:hypothetical protein TNCV_1044981 [Trichonephila clavipes]|nr:hypothetical protein TNCV_1044981 [Trichonephila clavipes]